MEILQNFVAFSEYMNFTERIFRIFIQIPKYVITNITLSKNTADFVGWNEILWF